ncbi:Ig-like domain-containing protein [Motilibacter peucedani]|uniref:Ig-like domain-containing protein n=1 Tax=Motilibacter peucedani TaxID=598650 RepID=A0A420XK55_9ACTN|nr:Ig-like domain repeat protein [Motilibacter peucedani]RKS68006.1 Ig-like domain-containing protein [Motilibacter peucedani]
MRSLPVRPAALLTALLLAVAVLPATAGAAAAAPAGNLLSNGSFEDPAVAVGTYDVLPSAGAWRQTGPCGIEVENRSTVTAYDGDQVAELDSDCSTSFAQDVDVTPGAAYQLSYAFSARPGVADNALKVRVDGTVVAERTADGSALSDADWHVFTETVRASSGTMTVELADRSVSDTLGTLVDAVSLVPVPDYDPVAVAQNTSWTNAAPLAEGTDTAGRLGGTGEARWYSFPVVPSSTVTVGLTGLSADADLTLYTDIGAAFTSLRSTSDLARLGSEQSGDAFSPSIYSPSIYSPSIYSPSIYSPSIYSPSIYSPSIYSPSIYSPSIYSPSIYSPSIYSPSIYSPSIYSPSIYSPDQAFLDAFSGAQTRSLIAVSANDGVAAESVSAGTWNSTGRFYVRVQSRDGAGPTPFTVRLTTTGGPCTGFTLDTGSGTPLPAVSGTPATVVLTDTARLGLTGTAKTSYLATLGRLAADQRGVVVDAADVARTRLLNAQADAHPRCAYAKNLVAQSLRDVVNAYRGAGSTLKYVVIAGADPVVPFFRYADDAGLGPESDFVPPVRDDSGSQASLRSNLVLGQDAYGTLNDLNVKGSVLPVPDLAVGRLVETPAEITAQVDRFLGLAGGTLPTPKRSLVTGYDFLTSAADAVQADLVAGLGSGATTDALVTAQGVPTTTTTVSGRPDRQHSWTATDLKSALLGSRHDIVFLAGHFGSSDALAADYETTVTTADLAARPGLLAGSLVFSAGCHSGYSLADGDGIAGLTNGLDWAQEMAQQGATLVAGTGYQYADTDFLAYSAKLYAQFAHQLRSGTAGTAVRVGPALVQAKQDYLAGLGSLTGIDVKTLLEASVYGLPMTGLDLPGRASPVPATPALSTAPVADGTPGAVLGLRTAPLDDAPATTVASRAVLGLDGTPTGASYRWLTGPDGVQTAPALPALPQQVLDVTSADGSVLRGVGFRSGTYADTPGTTPLTGAPGTEHNGIHTSFASSSFFPHRLATPNWSGALTSTGDGRTRLVVTPAQYRAEPGATTSTERRYSSLGLQLFYSSNISTYGANTPALAAPPSISQVSGTASADGTRVAVTATVTGDPSAGIQSAWITYTAGAGPLHGTWASLDLRQSATDSRVWTGELALPAGQSAADVRFVVQAVNGVGLVAFDDASDDGYAPVVPSAVPPVQAPTSLSLGTSPRSGRYGDTVAFTTRVTGAPTGSTVTVALGATSATGTTAADGSATVRLPLRTTPGSYAVTASYAGDATHAPASATRTAFTVGKALTLLTPGATVARTFTLTSGSTRLQDKAVLVDAWGTSKGRVVHVVHAVRRTDADGRVDLSGLTLVPGVLAVTAVFGADVPGSPADPLYGASASATVVMGR